MRTLSYFVLILTFCSCRNPDIASSQGCGCDGKTTTILQQEEGTIKIERIGATRYFRIVNQSKDLYLAVCDSTSLDQASKVPNAIVRFSGDVKPFCSQPNVQYLPPLYLPIRVIKISVL